MSATDFCFGDNEQNDKRSLLAAYAAVDSPTTLIGGGRMPNGWGLFDMHGNLFEWCWDVYGEETSVRVLRGGSCFGIDVQYLRSASRTRQSALIRNRVFGFRVCRSL